MDDRTAMADSDANDPKPSLSFVFDPIFLTQCHRSSSRPSAGERNSGDTRS